MRFNLIILFVISLLPPLVSQAQPSFQIYSGCAIGRLTGENEMPLPGLLQINSGKDNSTGWLIGVNYTRQFTNTGNIGIDLYTFALKTDVFISRVQTPPESLQFREITLRPFYQHKLIQDKLFLSVGPQFSFLTNHKELYTNSSGETFAQKFSSRNNFSIGLNGGLSYRFSSIWIGVNLSLPLRYLDKQLYADYLTTYTSGAVKLGYSFE